MKQKESVSKAITRFNMPQVSKLHIKTGNEFAVPVDVKPKINKTVDVPNEKQNLIEIFESTNYSLVDTMKLHR